MMLLRRSVAASPQARARGTGPRAGLHWPPAERRRGWLESETLRKGREIRRELMGADFADRMGSTVYDDPLMQKLGAYSSEAVFGLLWSRPGLDLKTRALICVISD